MGSGATKINSHETVTTESEQKSGSVSYKESNNNVTTTTTTTTVASTKTKTGAEVGVNREKEIRRPTSNTRHNFEVQKPKPGPESPTKKSKVVSSKTEVLSLKSRAVESEMKENEKSSGVINQLHKELADSESQRLDLQEQLQIWEEKVSSNAPQPVMISNSPDSFQQTLHAKDQYIIKLEREAKANQVESNRLRIKLKKRIKSLTNQLFEVRQDSSISQMEVKSEITRQNEEIKLLKAGLLPPSSSIKGAQSYSDQDHSKIIVELSNQLSEQAEQISSLQTELSEKKKEICDFKLALDNNYDTKDPPSTQNNFNSTPILPQTSTDRLHSSRGKRMGKSEPMQGFSKKELNLSPSPFEDSKTKPYPMERQSTALSDSDSDWENGSTAPSHTHSAPARSRIKSAISIGRSEKQRGSLTTLNGNDDSIIDLVSASPIDPLIEHRTGGYKKSALKTHLEKTRVEKQSNSLMGPSLAFERGTEPFSDTSCEPTPRLKRIAFHPDSKIRIVKPIIN